MPSLEFKGKQHIYAHHLTVPYRPLVVDPAKSLRPTTADSNLIIHGDNLHALKALLPRYAGRVKCIYIDPPYNTGNEGWIYNDKVNSPLMQAWLQANSPVDGEDLERHDKWLCMMWPRLHLLRELLSDDGAIFVSIDDNEQHHLRMLMDEIFGEANLVAEIPWASGSPKNDTDISVQHEYLIGYAKVRRQKDRRLRESNFSRWFSDPTFAIRPEPLSTDGFSNPDGDERGAWKLQTFHAPNIRPNLTYPIVNPETRQEHWPPSGRCWRMTQEQYLALQQDNRILFGRDGKSMPHLKVYYSEVKAFGVTPQSWWSGSKYGNNAAGTTEFKEIFGDAEKLDYPKPSQLVKHLLTLSTGPNDIILDSFAGSGTTAHAVLALNKADGGNRQFILVECEDYADSITAERVRRVINGVPGARDKALQAGLGGSFAYCTLGAPIDPEKMLTGEALPSWSSLAAYLLHTAAGLSVGGELQPQDGDGRFYETETTAWHLLYQPEIAWLRSSAAVLTEDQAKRIHSSGKAAYVFAADKYIGQRMLTDLNITFCQLPYELHRRGW